MEDNNMQWEVAEISAPEIVDYYVVCVGTQYSFITRVKELILEGWEPQGGVTYNNGLYMQAMIKYA